MKSILTAACVVFCAAVLSAQVAPAPAKAGARTTAPGALTGGRTPGTLNPEPGTSAKPGTPNPEPGTSAEPGTAANPGTPNPEPGTSSSLSRVQALYGSAAYEDALAAMPAAGAGATREIEQYRALCLLALGRQPDAAAAVDRITAMDPLGDPGPDTPPRLQAMYTEARVRLAPGLAKDAYGDAKAAWEKKDVPAAHAAFQRTLDVIAVVPDPAAAGLSDLRELASGFLQLSAATAAANAGPEAGTPAAARPPTAAGASAAEPGGVPAPAETSPAAAEAPFSGPVAIRQDMPAWQPPDAMARRLEYHGVVHVMIDATGRVEDVRVIKPSHPAYDAAVVRAARQWAFTPASRGGRPVASEKDIEVFLRPQ